MIRHLTSWALRELSPLETRDYQSETVCVFRGRCVPPLDNSDACSQGLSCANGVETTDEAAQGAAIVSQILSNYRFLLYIYELYIQTPHTTPLASAFSPTSHGLLERRGRGSALTICLPECGESSKGATARAWPADAHSYSPPSRPACLLMIAAATSSRLTPTYPIPTPTC